MHKLGRVEAHRTIVESQRSVERQHIEPESQCVSMSKNMNELSRHAFLPLHCKALLQEADDYMQAHRLTLYAPGQSRLGMSRGRAMGWWTGMLFWAKDCSTCSANVWGVPSWGKAQADLDACSADRCSGIALHRFRWPAKVRAASTTDCECVTCIHRHSSQLMHIPLQPQAKNDCPRRLFLACNDFFRCRYRERHS